jgi:NodT family efflux transporter outer membrane factor (OMF) lipoprotein
MVTHLVSEIAHSYYELLALDNRLKLLEQNISILENALKIVKLQKQAAKVTELAVKRFEAEMLDNQSRLYYVKQQIIETENKINYLVGRYPTTIIRSSDGFNKLLPQKVYSGIPAQLMQHRPDVRQAENLLAAAKLDVAIAKAEFYPSIKLTAGLGFQAFNPQYIVTTPESMLYSLAGELVAPVINRNAIKANYYSANSKQIQAIIEYQSTVLNAYVEVVNQLASINNLNESYNYKQKQVKVLNESITIASNLFKSARADYMEVLMTQRDALESKVELVETKRDQFMSMISLYEALGGGWN